MIDVAGCWNPKQALLKEIIHKADRFEEARELCLTMHSLVHTSEMSKVDAGTFEDRLWDGVDESTFRTMPDGRNVTIAWNLWHLTRIEDITSNILMADDNQVLSSDNWLERMNVNICDTGNAMGRDEVNSMSRCIDIKELRNYRIAVGRKTQEIIKALRQSDMKQKVKRNWLNRILDEGGVLEETKGLLEFWGKKTIGGILLMPITRHQVVHLNDALKIKHMVSKRKVKT